MSIKDIQINKKEIRVFSSFEEFDAADPADAVDATENVGLFQLRRRTTQFVPAAGIDNEQTAVGVLQHVGRMEI